MISMFKWGWTITNNCAVQSRGKQYINKLFFMYNNNSFFLRQMVVVLLYTAEKKNIFGQYIVLTRQDYCQYQKTSMKNCGFFCFFFIQEQSTWRGEGTR
jgi:hypothetical protein